MGEDKLVLYMSGLGCGKWVQFLSGMALVWSSGSVTFKHVVGKFQQSLSFTSGAVTPYMYMNKQPQLSCIPVAAVSLV